jgi:hypothetical protein
MPSGITSARRHVEALRTALLSPSPEEIERCLPGLEEAVRCLTGSEKEPPDAAACRALRNELRIVSRLIEHGTAFCQGWAKLLGAATAGYLPTGEAAPIARLVDGPGSVSVRG